MRAASMPPVSEKENFERSFGSAGTVRSKSFHIGPQPEGHTRDTLVQSPLLNQPISNVTNSISQGVFKKPVEPALNIRPAFQTPLARSPQAASPDWVSRAAPISSGQPSPCEDRASAPHLSSQGSPGLSADSFSYRTGGGLGNLSKGKEQIAHEEATLPFSLHSSPAPVRRLASPVFSSPDSDGSDDCPKTSAIRAIPGPAGAVQRALAAGLPVGQAVGRRHAGPSTSSQSSRSRLPDLVDGDFQKGSWLTALHTVGIGAADAASAVLQSSCKAIRQGRCGSRIGQMVVIVGSLSLNASGDADLLLKDPTGTIEGVMHRTVLADQALGSNLAVGAAVVLQNVAVFSPSLKDHYLSIVLNNVVRVIPKHGGLPSRRSFAAGPSRGTPSHSDNTSALGPPGGHNPGPSSQPGRHPSPLPNSPFCTPPNQSIPVHRGLAAPRHASPSPSTSSLTRSPLGVAEPRSHSLQRTTSPPEAAAKRSAPILLNQQSTRSPVIKQSHQTCDRALPEWVYSRQQAQTCTTLLEASSDHQHRADPHQQQAAGQFPRRDLQGHAIADGRNDGGRCDANNSPILQASKEGSSDISVPGLSSSDLGWGQQGSGIGARGKSLSDDNIDGTQRVAPQQDNLLQGSDMLAGISDAVGQKEGADISGCQATKGGSMKVPAQQEGVTGSGKQQVIKGGGEPAVSLNGNFGLVKEKGLGNDLSQLMEGLDDDFWDLSQVSLGAMDMPASKRQKV